MLLCFKGTKMTIATILNNSAYSWTDEYLSNPQFKIVASVPWEWEDAFDTPLLKDLRDRLILREVIKNAKTPLSQAIAISYFVNQLWQHSGTNDPGTKNPLEIVERAARGESFRCVEYARVLSACLRSIGIPARFLGLKMKDVETIPSGAGHIVVEAFIQDKWIMIDPQANFIPEANGTFLNALEFREHLKNYGGSGIENGTKDSDLQAYLDAYLSWIHPYLHYLDTYVNISERTEERIMLVPLGSKIPKKFQITSNLDHFIYTFNAESFYENPKKLS